MNKKTQNEITAMSEKNLREYDQFSFNCPTNNLKAIRITAQIAELPFFLELA